MRIPLAVIAALLILGVACGGDDDDDTGQDVGSGDPTEPCTPSSEDPDEPVSSDDPPPCPTEPINEDDYDFGEFGVDDVDVAIAESFPVQVFVSAHGSFSDGCTEIHEVEVEEQGSTFVVTITTRRPIGAICTQAIVEHTENVPLGSPQPGDYTVTVNGVSEAFTVSG
jgi:hypothetical protein